MCFLHKLKGKKQVQQVKQRQIKWIASSQWYCVTTKCKHHSVFPFCETRIWFAGMTAGNECRLFFASTTQQICQYLLKRMALCMTFLVVNRLFENKWSNVASLQMIVFQWMHMYVCIMWYTYYMWFRVTCPWPSHPWYPQPIPVHCSSSSSSRRSSSTNNNYYNNNYNNNNNSSSSSSTSSSMVVVVLGLSPPPPTHHHTPKGPHWGGYHTLGRVSLDTGA